MNEKFKNESDLLCQWYLKNKRDLPWRQNQDPYKIWISEIMLQQTTVQAVIPYFEKFITQFPNVKVLANAREEDVLKMWAGLGYYSRARNIYKAAQIFAKNGFAPSFTELSLAPGLGPYTSRAVSSLAFNEPVGVLDGNVIRILTRLLGLKIEWWKTDSKNKLQNFADLLAKQNTSSTVNQAMMELGATICTPQSPACALCPWIKHCIAFKKNITLQLPLKKERKAKEFWLWTPILCITQQKIALSSNHALPFLKKFPLPPGGGIQLKEKPKKFDFHHTITHHHIFVKIQKVEKLSKKEQNIDWISLKKLTEHNPTSLLKKTLDFLEDSI